MRATAPRPVLLVPLLLGSATTSPPGPRRPGHPRHLRPRFPAYADAASAVRRKDCAAAYKILSPLTAGKGPEAAFSQLLTGLYAHSCEQAAYAEDRLFAATDPDGPLEDWRLYILSDAPRPAATSCWRRPRSPSSSATIPARSLRPRALLKAATIAWQRGDARRALELVAEARRARSCGGAEGVAARAARLGDRQPAGDRGRRPRPPAGCSPTSPGAASELQVVEHLPPPGRHAGLVGRPHRRPARAAGAGPAGLKLERQRRSRRSTPSPVPGRSARLVCCCDAQTLTRTHQGAAALTAARSAAGRRARQAAALAWARAQAADDAATA